MEQIDTRTSEKRAFSFEFCREKYNNGGEQIPLEDILNCWPSNRFYFERLSTQIGNVIPFVGAGLTCTLRRTSEENPLEWKDLIMKLARDGGLGCDHLTEVESNVKSGKFEEAAQVLEETLGTYRLQQKLKELFDWSNYGVEKLCDTAIPALLSLRPKQILTTNYDCAIEKQNELDYSKWSNKGSTSEPAVKKYQVFVPNSDLRAFSEAIRHDHPLIFKFHGSSDKELQGILPHDLILSRRSYDKIYGERKRPGCEEKQTETPLVRRLTKSLMDHPLLFLGCSLERDRILDLLVENNDGEHFAFVCIDDDDPREASKEAREKLAKLNEMRICPIFYPKSHHECIVTLLKGLDTQNNIDYAKVPQSTQTKNDKTYVLSPVKEEWMEAYFKTLESQRIHRHIIIFGGIFTKLRTCGSPILKSLNEWLTAHPEATLYICYDSEIALEKRKEGLDPKLITPETRKKLEEICDIPTNCFDAENQGRIYLIPIQFLLTGYCVVADDKLFWNIITEQKSAQAAIIAIPDDDSRNIKDRFISYLQHALKCSRDKIYGFIEKSLDENDPDPMLRTNEKADIALNNIDALYARLETMKKLIN